VSGDVGEVSAVREVDDLACEFEETGGVAVLSATFRVGDDSKILRRTIGKFAENQYPN